jgi:hydrogenase expression/formation protein HypE
MEEIIYMQGAVCPVPIRERGQIIMGHGSGGKLSHDLIARFFTPSFDNEALRAGDDSGVVQIEGTRLALSVDSHVVWPLFFPGGDIGRLAICGTVNDLAMVGATPLYLTAGFILEEGLPIGLLERVVASMQTAAAEAGVQLVAGDTKVVERGKADGLYISVSGVGLLPEGRAIAGALAQPGDVVILSGTMGDHGIAVLYARGELGFETAVTSDVAPLNHLVAELLAATNQIRVMRDPTRGGVATSLNEIARQSQVGIILQEKALPTLPAVQAACEMLGFDPLYIANEGKFLVVVGKEEADKALAVLRAHPYGRDAAVIGEVTAAPKGRVLLKTSLGSSRIVDVLAGEMLPRIC